MEGASGRHVIGAVLVDLVKFLKNFERTSGRPIPLSTMSRAAVDRRVMISEWVQVQVFHELLHVFDVIAVKGDEQRAMEMGAVGGTPMRGLLKAYSVPGDPVGSVFSMRNAWRAHYDFGRLTSERTSDATVRFTVSEYLDMPMIHGMMTVGWGVAAARAAGAADLRVVVFERPWRGASELSYEFSF